MNTTCILIDLNEKKQVQQIDLKNKSILYINQLIDTAPYGTLLLFISNNDFDKLVVMCPGGGLIKINDQHEGTDFIHWFLAQNINYGILKYHLPAEDRYATLNDGLKSVRIIRGMYPQIKQIGMMGASIGGYLAAHTAIFGADDSKIDFQILMYPVINMQNVWTHLLSRERLLGKDLNETEQIERSLEYQISQTTPITFIVAASDDPVVSPINSIRYSEYLVSNKIPTSFHLYPIGGHSFGFNDFEYKQEWLSELKKWLESF